jgi:hypothetical protein
MTAVPLLSGVQGSETAEFKTVYPLNLEPVVIDSKISKGQLKAVPGAVQAGTGPGADRGGIEWNGVHYRVMGTQLCQIAASGVVTQLGDVGSGGRCRFDYSFTRLAINSGDRLYYYDPSGGLIQVTDTDLGAVVDMMWIDGYFMTTDGTYVVVTELSDATSVMPLKYGSAEEDPDPITGLLKYRNEAYIVGRHTIQLFKDVGGNGWPFQTVGNGTTIPAGAVGPKAKCLIGEGFAFVGGGRNEALNVFVAGQAEAKAIGCPELCEKLDALPDPSVVELEQRASDTERRLLVHLPDETWAYLLHASADVSAPVWYRLKTDDDGYRCRNAVLANGKWWVGDTQSGAVGYLTDENRLHFGIDPGWSFDCGFLYNQSLGAIVDSVELVGLPGRGGDGAVFLSMTEDGETFSAERSVISKSADRKKRIAWRPHRRIRNYLGLRFRGFGSALPGIASCEVKARPLQ